jgi:hypothetical protein
MRTRRVVCLILCLAVATAVVCGCGSKKSDNPVRVGSPVTIMAVQASPDAPAVDVVLDGHSVLPSDTAYSQGLRYAASTGYIRLSAAQGTNTIEFRDFQSSTLLASAMTQAPSGEHTIFLMDSLASIETLAIDDTLTAPEAGKARVRFVNLTINAPVLDLAVAGGPIWFGNVGFRGYTPFKSVDAGTCDLEFRLAGTSGVGLRLNGVSFQAGRIYTLLAKGFVGGSGAQAPGVQIILNN